MVQTLSPYHTVPLVEAVEYDAPKLDAAGQPRQGRQGQRRHREGDAEGAVLAVGPAASQIAIKQLGTNGGGFFNVNSAHPFENPTPLSNFLEVLAILVISAALCYTFGRMVGDTRQGWAILAAMTIVFVALLALCVGVRAGRQPAPREPGRRSDCQPGAVRRQHGRARRRGSASSTRRCGRRRRRLPRTVRSTPCTTRTRRWAGSCRCG